MDTCRPEPNEKCFACGRKLGKTPLLVDTRDGQTVFVGRECAKLVLAMGEQGYRPPRGGPKLYPMKNREEKKS